ncbi:MAG: glycoside hydrolase family 28 protein [Paracoccus sp. (in: a-proteobacteria)]|nr:glycoside hydrolase family 28 protein [Paracoccus sp. (in: a-proteobacteria)]
MLTIFPVAVTPRMAVLRLALPGALYHQPAPVVWRLEDNQGRVLREGETDRAVLPLSDLAPGEDYLFRAEGFDALPFRTPPCPGAATLGAPDQAQALLDSLPDGGTLLIPPGRHEITPLILRRPRIIHLAQGATLAATADRETHPVITPGEGATWEGLPEPCYAALVTAIGAGAVAITGLGALDGGGNRGDWWDWPKETRGGARRSRLVHLIGCDGATVAGVTLQNAPSWTLHPWRCRDLVCAGLHIINPPDSPNTDGLNPESCENTLIEGVRFSVGDDCIAIKAGKRGPLVPDAGSLPPTRGVTIRHCWMERGHGGVVIGSEMSGGVEGVTITDCRMTGTDRGLRIKTRRGRGGAVRDIFMASSVMEDVGTAIAINMHYFCDADGRSDEVQSRAPAPVTDTTPHIENIRVEGLHVTGLRHAFLAALGLPEAPIAGVSITDASAEYAPDAPPEPPLMADHIRAVSGAGLLAEHCEILTAPDLPRGTLTEGNAPC